MAYDRALTDWLLDQGLSKYEHFLISNGFDDMRFMVGIIFIAEVTIFWIN